MIMKLYSRSTSDRVLPPIATSGRADVIWVGPNSLIPPWMSPYQASVAARMPPGTTLDLAQVGAPVQPGQITFTSGRVTRSAEVLTGAATGGTVTVRLLPR